MSLLFRTIGYLLILGSLGLFVILGLAIETQPTVRPGQTDSSRYLATTRDIIQKTVHSPMEQQNIRSIALTAEDLTAVANFALTKKHLQGNAQTWIHQSRIDFLVSIRLPQDLYLNVQVVADDAEPRAIVKQIKLGRIAFPRSVVYLIESAFIHFTRLGRYSQLTAPLVREVRIGDERLKLSLNWTRKAFTQAQEVATDLASKERLLVYHNKLAEVLNHSETKRYVNLGYLTQPLFTLALIRSVDSNNDPREENRALILVLGAFANGGNVLQDIDPGLEPAELARRWVLLNRRVDTAQHFMGSAMLAIGGHRTLTDMVGLAKEINDTHSGSGFSFTDLAANRAGARFGKISVESDQRARRVQTILSQSTAESVYMPKIKDLPENLRTAEFARRFKDIESPEFEEVKQLIEERIDACPLYQ